MGKIIKWHLKFTFTISLNEDNMKWIFARILEPSSWAGIGILVSTIDTISNNGTVTQVEIGAILTALVAIFMPGKMVSDTPEVAPEIPSNNIRNLNKY